VAGASAINRPFKLDGSLIDFDENEVADPIDFKKRYTDDIATLENTMKENVHAQENMEMGSLNKELAVGLVEDVKKNLHDVAKHIDEDIVAADQGSDDQSEDSQGKLNMAEFEAKMHNLSEDGAKAQKEQVRKRAEMIKDIIPTTVELEQKLNMLPEGSFIDKDMEKLETKMDKILAQTSDVEKKPAKKTVSKR
jgi:hypothetical protein